MAGISVAIALAIMDPFLRSDASEPLMALGDARRTGPCAIDLVCACFLMSFARVRDTWHERVRRQREKIRPSGTDGEVTVRPERWVDVWCSRSSTGGVDVIGLAVADPASSPDRPSGTALPHGCAAGRREHLRHEHP